MLFTKNRPDN
ncbi:hypothetical protein YPPY89_2238, partial [Yersinia pestis PY-89]